MGLTRLLARAAARRLHVLLVEGDDAFVLRTAVERACQARGWVLALSPADADVLLTCRPLPGLVSDAADTLFDQMPRPRARAEVWHERHLDAVLDDLHAAYLSPPAPDDHLRRPRGHGSNQVEPPTRTSMAVARHLDPELVPGPSGQNAAPAPAAHGHPGGHGRATAGADNDSSNDAPDDAPREALAEHQPADRDHTHQPQSGPENAGTGEEHSSRTARGPDVGSDHAMHTHPKAAEHGEHGMNDEHDEHGEHGMHGMHGMHDEHGMNLLIPDAHDEPEDHGAHGHDMPHGHDMAHGHDMSHGHDMGHGRDMGHDMNMDMDMGMEGPGGIDLASGARDLDGLEMDRLHVRLGPVLARWPAGLVVWCTVAGDVVTQVDVVQPGFSWPRGAGGDLLMAARLDAAVHLLALAGASAAAVRVQAARDAVLASGRRRAPVVQLVDQVSRHVDRTPLLRWSLRGLGVVSELAAVEHGWPGSWVGDVHTRLLRLLDPLAPLDVGLVEGAAVAGAIPLLLPGLDVAAARLVVASLGAQIADRVVVPLPVVR